MIKVSLPLLRLCALMSLPLLTAAQTYNIRDFGAVGDGRADDTMAIQAAIDACTETGGTVLFPAGDYQTGMIEVKSNVTIHLVNTATWYGIPDPVRYPPVPVNTRRVFIYANQAENIRFEGAGMIHGNGQNHEAFIPQFGHLRASIRPYGFLLWQCRNVSFDGLRLRNSAFWMLRLDQCDDVMIRNIDLVNHSNYNNDGIDIVDCHRVTLSDSILDCEDDSVCLKSEAARGTIDVVVTNCIISSHASAIKMGTASVGTFKNIAISNCVIRPSRFQETLHPAERPNGLAGIDLMSTDGGELSQISINNIVMDGSETALFIRLGNRHRVYSGDEEGNRDAVAPPETRGRIHDISISNITATNIGKISSAISAYPGAYVERIRLSNIDITLNETGLPSDRADEVPEHAARNPFNRMFESNLTACGLFLRHVKDIQIDNFTIRPAEGEPRADIYAENVHGMTWHNIQTRHPHRPRPEMIFVNCTDVREL